MKIISLYSFILIFLTFNISARTFTNIKGKKISATIMDVEGSKVKLKLTKNKKVYSIEILSLSQGDQDYIKQWKEDQKAKEETKDPAKEKKSEPFTPSMENMNFHNVDTIAKLKKEFNLKENYGAKWPKDASVGKLEVKTISEDEAAEKCIYRSTNYEFISDAKLSPKLLTEFAQVFEATKLYMKKLPLSMMKAHIPDGKRYFKIYLFTSDANYTKNGGSPRSPGFYSQSKKAVFLKLSSIGIKKSGGKYVLNIDKRLSNPFHTLRHEATHQLDNFETRSPGAEGWFTEGLAEFIALTPYKSGKFTTRNHLKEIAETIKQFKRGTPLQLPRLKKFLTQGPVGFENVKDRYLAALAITTYFIYLNNDDDHKKLEGFLKSLKIFNKPEDAHKTLLSGKTYEELENDVIKAWKKKGVKIKFQ